VKLVDDLSNIPRSFFQDFFPGLSQSTFNKKNSPPAQYNEYKRKHSVLRRAMLFGLIQRQTLPYVPGCASKQKPAGWGPTKRKTKDKKRSRSGCKSRKQGAASTTSTEAVSSIKLKKADEVPSIGHFFVLGWKGAEAIVVDPLCTTTATKCADTLKKRGFTVIRPQLWKRWKGDHIMCGL
jgi:hypothetical protein